MLTNSCCIVACL